MLDFGIFLESKPILYTLIFLGIVLGTIWLLSIYWVYQDIFKRTKNIILQIISIVIVIIFPFFGLRLDRWTQRSRLPEINVYSFLIRRKRKIKFFTERIRGRISGCRSARQYCIIRGELRTETSRGAGSERSL